jgi:hypothetical protein
LAAAIRDIEVGVAARFSRPIERRGYGVTWWEVVYIWLPALGGAVSTAFAKKVVEVAIDWARKRFKRRGAEKRPKYVGIYGPDGKLVRSVLLTDEAAEPEDRPAEPRKPPSRFEQ